MLVERCDCISSIHVCVKWGGEGSSRCDCGRVSSVMRLRCAPLHAVQLEEFRSDATNSLEEGLGAVIHLRSVEELHAEEWG